MNLITIISPQPSFKLLEPNMLNMTSKPFFLCVFFLVIFFFLVSFFCLGGHEFIFHTPKLGLYHEFIKYRC